jgi:hypothetical protein
MSAALEKRLVDGSNVAGTDGILLAAVHTAGNLFAFSLHHWNGSASCNSTGMSRYA